LKKQRLSLNGSWGTALFLFILGSLVNRFELLSFGQLPISVLTHIPMSIMLWSLIIFLTIVIFALAKSAVEVSLRLRRHEIRISGRLFRVAAATALV